MVDVRVDAVAARLSHGAGAARHGDHVAARVDADSRRALADAGDRRRLVVARDGVVVGAVDLDPQFGEIAQPAGIGDAIREDIDERRIGGDELLHGRVVVVDDIAIRAVRADYQRAERARDRACRCRSSCPPRPCASGLFTTPSAGW